MSPPTGGSSLDIRPSRSPVGIRRRGATSVSIGGVIRGVNNEARLADLRLLLDAQDPEELHRVLVLYPPAAFEREPMLPVIYFRNVHERGADGAVVTAMLLATDPRFRTTAGPLIAKIAETAIVPAEELDVLARAFIAADNGLFWECPPHWFVLDSIEIELGVSQISPVETSEDDEGDDIGPTVTRRVVPPALRRWATTRLLAAETAAWSGLFGRARELGGADGGAIIRGLLDMVGSLPPNAVENIRSVALQWPRVDVRNAAAARNSQHEGRQTRTSTDSTKPSGVAPGTRRADPRPSLFD